MRLIDALSDALARRLPRVAAATLMAVSAAAITVTVRSGDTLSSIAQHSCGHAGAWHQIYAQNGSIIGGNPNLIMPGQVLHFNCQGAALTTAEVPARPHHRHHYAAAPAHVAPSGSSFERCVITRESGGNARAVNPASGAGGLYQFLPSTWAALGFSGLPQNASVATQKAAFSKAYAQWGRSPWSPYDGC